MSLRRKRSRLMTRARSMRPDEVTIAFGALASVTSSLGSMRVAEIGATDGVYFALDADGTRHLLVSMPDGEHPEEDKKSAGVYVAARVLQGAGPDTEYADLVANIPSLNPLFSVIVSEVIEELLRGTSRTVAGQVVLDNWREMIEATTKPVGLSRQVGLFGELWQLREVARRGHVPIGVWAGPAGGRHDLSGVTGHDIEVKTSRGRHARIVTVHSLEQLELGNAETLHLACMRVEPVSLGGDRIDDLVADIASLGIPRSDLTARLEMLGVVSGILDTLDQRFEVMENQVYRVDASFPRLAVPNPGRPSQVVRVIYDLDLTGDPPTPLSEADVDSVYASVGAAL
jgi:hypothetical protein